MGTKIIPCFIFKQIKLQSLNNLHTFKEYIIHYRKHCLSLKIVKIQWDFTEYRTPKNTNLHMYIFNIYFLQFFIIYLMISPKTKARFSMLFKYKY